MLRSTGNERNPMTTVRINTASARSNPMERRQDPDQGWGVAVHLIALVLSPLVAIIINIVYGARSEFVHQHARQAINFHLNVLAAFVAVGLATALSEKFILLWVPVGVGYVVMPIVAAVRASRGRWLPYPALIPFLRSLPEPQ